jgi:hypothetical protein
MILAGWAFSNDRQKQLRWQETIEWAKRHGCAELVTSLPLDSMHVVGALSDYEIGPGGGPMYLQWSFDSKAKVGIQEKQAAIEKLGANWTEVAGSLSAFTEPMRFTGAKGRRLLVSVNCDFSPPWGSWTKLEDAERRRHFTRFRADVNAAIAPLVVDHIDFIPRTSQSRT